MTDSNKTKQHIREKFKLVEQSLSAFFTLVCNCSVRKSQRIWLVAWKTERDRFQAPYSLSPFTVPLCKFARHAARLNPKQGCRVWACENLRVQETIVRFARAGCAAAHGQRFGTLRSSPTFASQTCAARNSFTQQRGAAARRASAFHVGRTPVCPDSASR